MATSIQHEWSIETYLPNLTDNVKRILSRPEKVEIPTDILDTDEHLEKVRISTEVKRRQMKCGAIWQYAIGNWKGWEDLGTGHSSGLDIRSVEKKIIGELKNRWNTDNSSSKKENHRKLLKYKMANPQYTCIYGHVNDKTPMGKIVIENIARDEKENVDGGEITHYYGEALLDFIFGEHKDLIVSTIKSTIAEFDKNSHLGKA